MLQVFIMHRNSYTAILGKRNNKEVFLNVSKVESPYMQGLRENDCSSKPRYGYYMKGLKKAIQLVKKTDSYINLEEDELICFIIGCNNVIGWFSKHRAVAPYESVFKDICTDLDELTNPVNFLFDSTTTLERRYCRAENVETEKMESIGSFLNELSNKKEVEEGYELFAEAFKNKN